MTRSTQKHEASAATPTSAKQRSPKTKSKAASAKPGKAPSKAAQARALFEKGLTKAEVAKKTGIPYAYVWDIEAAWKRSKVAK